MNCIAFPTACAVMAEAFIRNHALAARLEVEVATLQTNAIILPEHLTKAQQELVNAVIEKFGGKPTSELPPPPNFYDPQPIKRRKADAWEFTTRGERDRKLDTGRGRRISKSALTDKIKLEG